MFRFLRILITGVDKGKTNQDIIQVVPEETPWWRRYSYWGIKTVWDYLYLSRILDYPYNTEDSKEVSCAACARDTNKFSCIYGYTKSLYLRSLLINAVESEKLSLSEARYLNSAKEITVDKISGLVKFHKSKLLLLGCIIIVAVSVLQTIGYSFLIYYSNEAILNKTLASGFLFGFIVLTTYYCYSISFKPLYIASKKGQSLKYLESQYLKLINQNGMKVI